MSRPGLGESHQLIAIGLAAGLLSALMGVGGGILVVPALVILLGFPSKVATGTSLAAITATALTGAVIYGLLGYVDLVTAAMLGIPASAGVLGGTQLQQRLGNDTVQLAFAAFLVAVAGALLVRG